jgi:hypothetical protein
VDFGARDAVLLGVRQHGADLDQRLLGRAGHCGAAECPDHAGAGDKRYDFIACEHQRRKVETFPHHVADAGFPIDRDARRLEIGDIAVDRALGHFEPRTKFLRGDEAATTEMLDDLE